MAAAGKWKLYEKAKVNLGNGATIDLTNTSNYKMALFTSASNANTLSGSEVFGDLTNEVAAANGYSAGGVAVAGESWTNASGTVTFTCANGVWNASGGSITARFAVIYINATVNSKVKPILCVCLLDTTPADVSATDGNSLTVAISGSGVFTLSGAATD